MDEEQAGRSSGSDTTQDRAKAYEVLVNAYYEGQQPAVTLSHAFLEANPILLEEGVLKVNWNRIPGLYTRVNQLLTVVVSDSQWDKWGAPGGWTVWEPDSLPTSFVPNMAVVMCKGPYKDSEDPALVDSFCYSMAIARVPDCVPLLPFNTLREAFKGHTDTEYTAVGLMRYHAASRMFPDVYFQYYQQHLTIMGLENKALVFGAADEFIAGYLIRRHQVASNRGAHAMLPPGYRFGATSPVPSPTYVYSVPGTGVPGQHPAIHSVHLAPLTACLLQPGRFCLGEPPVSEWHFNDSPIPWVLPESYRDPNRPDPNSHAPLPMQISTGGPVLGTTIQIADAVEAAGIRPEDGQEATEDDEEDDDLITVGDAAQPAEDPVIVSVTETDVLKATATGNPGGPPRLFESDDDESDAQVGNDVEAMLAEGGPLDIPEVVDNEEALAGGGDQSSDDDEEDEDGDDANVTRDYYANQELPPKETPSEIPKQSALMDMLARKKPTETLGNLGPTETSNPTNNNMTTGKGKGTSSGSSGKAPAPKLPDNPGAPGSTGTTAGAFDEATRGVQARAEETLFGAARLAHTPTGEDQMVRNLENYTGLLTGLQQLVMVMAQGYQSASEDIRELVSGSLARATERDRVFIQWASTALGEWTRAYQAAVGSQTNLPVFDLLQRWDRVRAAGNRLADEILSLTATETEENSSAEILHALIPACFNQDSCALRSCLAYHERRST